ncbi:E3 ubiquitin-protein ligase CSU1-like [Musa acuminata AAA Group]|uniref:E3 ubiquitin-protein ligase CSU1-like n=1 Tax=Musa acuminata AAA Group TaxID=214697 RepID=UPI0031D7C3CC
MPQRHSKNNNYLAFFTHEEKLKLGYGTQRERLGRDSIRPFDPCCLCIKHLIHPLFCQKGHLLCNECILECLLTQKKDIERQIAETSHQNLKMRRELHHDISHEIIASAVNFRVWNLDHIDYKSHKSSGSIDQQIKANALGSRQYWINNNTILSGTISSH